MPLPSREDARAAGTAPPPGAGLSREPEPAADPLGVELTRCVEAIARARDRAAFTALFNNLAPRLRTYFRMLGVPAAAAEEMTQETLLAIWNKAEQFDPARGGVQAWIFTIARNLRITVLRRERYTTADDGELLSLRDEAPGPEEVATQAERAARLRNLLRSLPEKDMTMLRMAFFEDKTHSQIEREKGIPLGTVKSNLRRTLRRLRAALGEPG